MNRFSETLAKLATKAQVALLQGARVIIDASDKEVPVDTGYLRSTRFMRVEGTGFGTVVTIGYTAPYAIYVHENLDAAHGEFFNALYKDKIKSGQTHKRRPTEKAKFLEDPIRNHLPEIGQAIVRAVKQ